MLNDKTILITGGTGSFGQKFTEVLFEKFKPKKVIIYSRDEFKQYEMAELFPVSKFNIRFFIGDIRDTERLERAFEDVDYCIHAAALKQGLALEYNPIEAVKTNILGANNVVEVALRKEVKKVIALSSDKAVNPVSLYGATKLAAEKIFINGNEYGGDRVKFSVVRYGNVINTRGSIIEALLKAKDEGIEEFPLTDDQMTRFWLTPEESVKLIIKSLEWAEGGEIFVPKVPSMKIVDIIETIIPKCTLRKIGIRAGEKIHEILITEEESQRTKEFNGIYVILPQLFENGQRYKKYEKYPFVPKGFIYRSDKNDRWLTREELKKILF